MKLEEVIIEKMALDLSDTIAKDKRRFKVYYLIKSFAPAFLSSLFTVLSAITSLSLYSFSLFLYEIYLFLIAAFIFGLFLLILNAISSKYYAIKEIVVNLGNIKQTGNKSYESKTRIKRISEKNLWKSIKLTVVELSEFAFLILFPGGLVDILVGYAKSSIGDGLNGMNQIIYGLILISFSLIFFTLTVIRHGRAADNKFNANVNKTKEMLKIINSKVEEQMINKLEKDGYSYIIVK